MLKTATEGQVLQAYEDAPAYKRESCSAALAWLRSVGRRCLSDTSRERIVSAEVFEGLFTLGLLERAYGEYWGRDNYNEETDEFEGNTVTITDLAWSLACRMAA